jgi:hypothetical protein
MVHSNLLFRESPSTPNEYRPDGPPLVSVLDATNAQGTLYVHWYGPDAAEAQPMAWNACCAASSFAFCLLLPTPSPLVIPLTGGKDLSKKTPSCNSSVVFTNAMHHPRQRVAWARLGRVPFDL